VRGAEPLADRPGVLGRISTVLGDHGVSISSVIQKGPGAAGAVPIVMLTHETAEEQLQAALARIGRLEAVSQPSVVLRIEG
jgi:homoserine dehydrogenase